MFVSAPGQPSTMIAPRDGCVQLIVSIPQPAVLQANVDFAVSFDAQTWTWAPAPITFYNIQTVQPSSGPVSGGTALSVKGVNLDGGGGYWCRLRCAPTPASCHSTGGQADILFAAALANASSGGVGLACVISPGSLALAGVGAFGGHGRYLFDISGPGLNEDGWTTSNLTVDLYRDFLVSSILPSLARSDRSTVLTIVGDHFISRLMCRFVQVANSTALQHSVESTAGRDADLEAIHSLKVGFEARVTNASVAACRVPPVPAGARGLYRLELSGNKQQVGV